MSQWSHSDFDFNDKTIPNNEALENSQKMNERVNSSLAIHQRPDSGELDPSYRTPRSGESFPLWFWHCIRVLALRNKTIAACVGHGSRLYVP